MTTTITTTTPKFLMTQEEVRQVVNQLTDQIVNNPLIQETAQRLTKERLAELGLKEPEEDSENHDDWVSIDLETMFMLHLVSAVAANLVNPGL